MPGRLRDVVETLRFERERRRIQPRTKRWDEVLQAVCYQLARAPEEGERTPKSGVWAWPIEPWEGLPLVVYYSFDEKTVHLESIIVGDSDADDS